MVIGFDGSRAFIESRTGTENYSYQLLKALARIDRENTYIVFTRRGMVAEKFPENFHFQQIKWVRFWTQVGLALQTFKDELDVLFVPAHTLPLIRRPGLKTVVTVHDLGSEYLPKYHQFKQRLYLGFMQKYQLKTASKIIAVSQSTKMDLVKKIGIDGRKISVIYEGYDKKLFSARGGSSSGRKSDILINSLEQYYLFVGTVQPRKNLERVIRAFSVIASEAKQSRLPRRYAPRNDNVKLVIVGSKGWLSDEIYTLPRKLGIEDKVKFLGYVPDEQLPALYSQALALVFPSLFEGFGLPILEAQACGCPVITSNISSMSEVAGKGAILVNPYDVDGIVKGMRQMENEKLRMEKVRAGFENIKRFSWEKAAQETLKVLESV